MVLVGVLRVAWLVGRLNYGDPQPMALRGRLVAVAEIAPELLNTISPRNHFLAEELLSFVEHPP